MIKTKEKLYFAYGSNMNLNQMAFRCPDAEVVESVRLEGYRLAFRTNGGGNGVATILPEEGSYVDGVLWRISERDEQHLDHYEGFPFLYGKEPVTVTNQDGVRREIMAYTMNSPYKDKPAMPSVSYLEGILNLDEKITIDYLCHKFYISPTTFKKYFRSIRGQPVYTWLSHKRMEKAAELLRCSSMTVLDVAQAIGYASLSQFNVAFKRHFNCTPRQYRNRSDSIGFCLFPKE